MALTVADLLAKLSLDTSGFRKGAEEASAASKKVEESAGKAGQATEGAGESAKKGGKGLGDLSKSLNETTQKFTELLTPANLFGTVIGVVVVAAIRNAIAVTTEYAQEMQRLQLVTGGTMGQIGELEDASSKLGIGTEKLKRAFFFLSSEIESGGRNLAKLGISIRDDTGAQRESLDIMAKVSEKFHGMTNETEKNVAARKLLSRQAVDMLPLFDLERKQLEQLGESGREFGERFGKDGVKGAILFGGALSEVGEAIGRAQKTIVMDFAPGVKLLADLLSQALDLFWKIPAPIRLIIETLIAAGLAFVALKIALVALVPVITAARLAMAAFGITAGVALSPVALIALGLSALLILGPPLAALLAKLLPQFVIDAWESFYGWVSKTWTIFKNFMGFTPAPPAPEPPKVDREKTLAEMQIELALNNRLRDAQSALARVTQDATSAAILGSKNRQQSAIDEINIELSKLSADKDADASIKAERAKLEAAKSYIIRTGAAERIHIYAQEQLELLTIQKQTNEQWLALEAVRRQSGLAIRVDEIEQAKKLVKDEFDNFGISQAEYVDETIRLNGLELKAKQDALGKEMQEVLADQKLKQKAIEDDARVNFKTAEWAAAKNLELQTTTDVKIATTRAKGVTEDLASAKENLALKQELANKEYAFVAQAEAKDLAQKIKSLEAWKAAHADNVKVVMAADAQLFQVREEGFNREVQTAINAWAEETRLYQSEADKQLAIEGGKFAKEKAAYDASVQNFINAQLAQTHYLQDALTKRLAEEAGYIHAVEQLRQQALDNAATVLEQEARQQGDLNAAFEVGFAHAASSAVDAFKTMGTAGAQTYHDLESGASDFLYEIISTSGKIGDIFVNLGKRMVRTITDAFAEIAVKWAMTAAGFSLPTLLGTGTAIAGAAVGFEGAPNQAATAMKALGETAQTANVALGGMAQVSGVVTGIFGSLGSLLLSFGTVVLGVIKLLASIMTAGGLGGGIGEAGSGLLSNLGSLGSAFSTFSNLIMGKLSDTIQSVFDAFGGSGVFSGALGPAGGAGVAAQLLADAIPIAGGIIGIAMSAINGNIGGTVGGAIGAGIGAFFGGPVGFAIGEMIGNFIGTLFGGLFSGPSPEISGKIELATTTIADLVAAKLITGGMIFQGKSQFSSAGSGGVYEETYKFRTQGTLSREEAQAAIVNVVLQTLQGAVNAFSQLGSQLPTETLAKALSAKIDAILKAGFSIAGYDFEGNTGEVVKSFQDFMKQLSGKALQAFTTEIFGNIDLSALGTGDVVKGFDALMQAMSAMGAILKSLDGEINTSAITIEQFASGSVTFFQGFVKEGEAFTDTVQRITQSLGGILALRDAIQTEIAALTNDTTAAMGIVTRQLQQAEQHVIALADAFTVAAESMAPPDEVLAKAQAVKDAIVQTLQAEIELVTKLRDEVVKLQQALTSALDFLGQLTATINNLSAAAPNLDAFIQQALTMWTMLTGNISAQIAVFVSVIQTLSAALQQAIKNSSANIGELAQTYQNLGTQSVSAILEEIKKIADPQEAIASLQALSGAVNTWLAGAIQAVQTWFAQLKAQAQAAAQAQIDALNAQRTAIQEKYTTEINAIRETQTAASDLKSKLDALTSSITTATALLVDLDAAIAKLAGTYSALNDFSQLLTDFPAKFAAIQELASPQEAVTALQQLAQQVQQALAAAIQEVQAHFAVLRADAQKVAQDRIAALNTEKTAVQAAFQVRKDALNKELEMARQWGTILASVKQLQTDIFNLLAPTHPQTSLDETLAKFRDLYAQFQAHPTPELGTQVQDLARQLIDLAKQTPGYDLPSANFQNLITEIQAALNAVAGIAGSQPTDAEIQARILALNQEETDTLKAIDDQITAINTDLQATLDDLSTQERAAIKALQDQAIEALKDIQDELRVRLADLLEQQQEASDALLAILGDQMYEQFMADTNAQIKALEEQQAAALQAIDAQIAQVNADLQATLTSLSQQEQDTIRGLQDIAARALSEIRDELVRQMTALQAQEAQAAAALQAIIGDKSFEQFIAEKQAEAVQALWVIDATLKWYLGELINRAFPGAGMPEAATGMAYVPQDGPVFLHRGERVLTAADNQSYLRGTTGGTTSVTINAPVTILASGVVNAKKTVDELEGELIERVKSGRLKAAITDGQRGYR